MADTSQAIEMIRRIIADDTADIRERLQHIEHKITTDVQRDEFVDSQEKPQPANPDIQDALDKLATKASVAEARLEQIKAIHKLDATPVQWTRGKDGRMVDAPEGLWEIACLGCTHKVVWQEGDKKPPQCKTWLIADGQV